MFKPRTECDVEHIFETYSDSTGRSANIYRFYTGEYHIYFYQGNELIGDDWRDTFELAAAAAEDWILYVE